MLEILFWVAIALLAYIYVGYLVVATAMARFRPRPVQRGSSCPTATVIITAFNEEKAIRDKILNVLALDYPAGCLDVIVASDASTDATDAISLGFSSSNVRLLRVEGRRGKTACQNAAAAAASGEILVFTDATTMVDAQALRRMAGNFDDPTVGCVAGRLAYRARGQDPTGHGGTSYWGYETRLRVAESRLGSLIGVSGQLYAVRRSAYRDIPPELISDFVIAMVMRDQGLRTVLQPDALCFEETLERSGPELSMRVRVGLRSLFAIAQWRRFLNPFRFGTFAWQLWSHKLLRYLSPVFWAIALVTNFALAMEGRYVAFFVAQVGVLVLGLFGFLPVELRGAFRLLAQPYYFVLTNVASALSLARFLRGDRIVTWTPLR